MAVSEKMVDAAREAYHNTALTSEQDRMRRALEAADAVRGGDAAPPAGTVAVRVAVAFDEDGGAHVWEIDGPLGEEGAWARLRTLRGAPLRSCTATIHAPLPDVAEVGATVEGV